MTRAPLLALALLALPAAAEAQRPPTAADLPRHFPVVDDLALMLRYLVEDGEAPGEVLGVLDPDGSTRTVSTRTSGSDSWPTYSPGPPGRVSATWFGSGSWSRWE